MSDNLPAVLVVEDDPGIQHLIRTLLKRLNVRTDVASNGVVALDLIGKNRYELIVLDLMMPVMNGVAFANELLRIAPELLNRTLVITALSPSHMEKSFGSSLPPLRLPILRKPFDITEFLKIVRKSLRIAAAATNDLIECHARFRDDAVRIGARAGILVAPNDDGETFDLVCSYGYAPETVESYFPMTIAEPLPICESFRSGRPVWIGTLASAFARYPQLAPIWMREDRHALAALPVEKDEIVIGAAGWTFSQPQQFDAQQQQQMLEQAKSYSRMIDRFAELQRVS